MNAIETTEIDDRADVIRVWYDGPDLSRPTRATRQGRALKITRQRDGWLVMDHHDGTGVIIPDRRQPCRS